MLIVKTIGNKLLQDTVAGAILHPFRPTLVENTSFVEQRTQKSEYRPKEVEIIVSNFEPNEGVNDKKLGEDWAEYKKGLGAKVQPDIEKFLGVWMKENGTKGKETKPIEDPEKIKNGKAVPEKEAGK